MNAIKWMGVFLWFGMNVETVVDIIEFSWWGRNLIRFSIKITSNYITKRKNRPGILWFLVRFSYAGRTYRNTRANRVNLSKFAFFYRIQLELKLLEKKNLIYVQNVGNGFHTSKALQDTCLHTLEIALTLVQFATTKLHTNTISSSTFAPTIETNPILVITATLNVHVD